MTDTDLIDSVANYSAMAPRTTAGVDAIFMFGKILATQPEFAQLRMVRTGTGWLPFRAEAASQHMLNIARNAGPAAAVAWLHRVSAVKEATFGAVKALYGVKCSSRIPMSDKVTLLPFAELPQSDTRDWIVQEHEAANERSGLHGYKAAPTAALFYVGESGPLFGDLQTANKNEMNAWFAELQEAALLLALIPRAIPMEAAHWLHVDDPDAAKLVNFGVSRSSPLDLHPPVFHDPPEISAELTNGLLPAYRKLDDKVDKPRFKLAVERLVRSRCQQIPGNRAIDLATALEVIFMGRDQGEHSYKISLRAARLLRDIADARRVVFTEVQRVYELRSSMVHTGIGSDTYNVNEVPRSANDLVDSVDVHCTGALRQILNRGAIPKNWREIELN